MVFFALRWQVLRMSTYDTYGIMQWNRSFMFWPQGVRVSSERFQICVIATAASVTCKALFHQVSLLANKTSSITGTWLIRKLNISSKNVFIVSRKNSTRTELESSLIIRNVDGFKIIVCQVSLDLFQFTTWHLNCSWFSRAEWMKLVDETCQVTETCCSISSRQTALICYSVVFGCSKNLNWRWMLIHPRWLILRGGRTFIIPVKGSKVENLN